MGWRLFLSGEKYLHFFRMSKSKDVFNIYMNNWTPMSNNPLRNPATCIPLSTFSENLNQCFVPSNLVLPPPLMMLSLSLSLEKLLQMMSSCTNTRMRLRDLSTLHMSLRTKKVLPLAYPRASRLVALLLLMSTSLLGSYVIPMIDRNGLYIITSIILMLHVTMHYYLIQNSLSVHISFYVYAYASLDYGKAIEKTSQRTPKIGRT